MKIVIPGDPIPKQRHRHYRRGIRSITFDPQDAQKKMVSAIIKQKFENQKPTGFELVKSFFVKATFYHKVCDSSSNCERNAKLWGLVLHTKKPDGSNELKFYEDAANEILYQDDSKIVFGSFHKRYDEYPRTEIEIMPAPELNLHPKIEEFFRLTSPAELLFLLNDAGEISQLAKNMSQAIDNQDDTWYNKTAYLVSAFADRHGPIIKKINSKCGNIEKHLGETK